MKLTNTFAVLLLAVAFVIAPIRLSFKSNGPLTIELQAAWAKDGDGDGDDGEGDDDGDDGEGDDDGDDGEGDDDEDDEDDDEGDDDGDDGDDESETPSSTSSNGQNNASEDDSWRPSGAISRIEVSSSGIEIRYANGAREEIQNGRYRVRNEKGQLVVQRRATGPDVVRLRALSERVSIQSVVGKRKSSSSVKSVSVRQNAVTVTYGNGWTETLRRNTYTLADSYGRTVVMRPATREDTRRLNRIARQNR